MNRVIGLRMTIKTVMSYGLDKFNKVMKKNQLRMCPEVFLSFHIT